MNKKLIIFLTFIGLVGIFTSCEKDGEQVVMSTNPVAPSILTLPDLTLQRNNATDTLVFTGTAVDPGFVASATYILEAAAQGTAFADPVTIYSGVKASPIKITVSDLNSLMLKKFPADQASSVDFRLRAVLVVDAGTGAVGTSENPLEYISQTMTSSVTIYGLPKLDLINSGIDQKLESPNGDGVYSGTVKLDPAMAFTLYDPDADVSYGATGESLVVDGDGIVVANSGWHKMTANVNDLSLTLEEYFIGLVGSATPNGWDAPDQKMDWDAATGTWSITIDLVDGHIKFRLNDAWAWNLGGTTDNLVHNGADIPISAGNYTITLTITNPTQGSEAGTCTIVEN